MKCFNTLQEKQFVVDHLSPVNAADRLSCDNSPDFLKKNSSHVETINARTDLPKCAKSNRACNEVLQEEYHKDQKQVRSRRYTDFIWHSRTFTSTGQVLQFISKIQFPMYPKWICDSGCFDLSW